MQLVQVEQVRFFTMLALKLIGEPKNITQHKRGNKGVWS